MKKSILIILILLSALTMAFGGGNIEKNERVKLEVWYSINKENRELFASLVKSFQKTHPRVDINLTYTGSYGESATKISAAKLEGKEPDVIFTASSQLFSGEDGNFLLEDADDYFNYDDFEGSVLEYGEYNSRLASLPFAVSTMVIYYNAEIIRNSSIDLLKNPPRTWDEFLETALIVQEANPSISVFDTSDSVWLFKTMLLQNENDIITSDNGNITPVFQNESGVEAALFWKELVDKSIMEAQGHESADNRFISGNLAFLASSSNRMPRFKDKIRFEIGAIEIPYFKTRAVALGGSTCAVLTKDEMKERAALELLSFMLDEDNQTEFALESGYLPVRKSALERDDVLEYAESNPPYAAALEELSYSRAYTHFPDMGAMDALLYLALDDIEKGTKEPEEALENAAYELLDVMH